MVVVVGLLIGFIYRGVTRMSSEQREVIAQQAVEDENTQRWIVGMFVQGDCEAASGEHLKAIHIYGKIGPKLDGSKPWQVKMRAELLARIASVRVDQKKNELAVVLASESIRLQDDYPIGFHVRGLAYCGLGKWDEARADMRQAAKLGNAGSVDALAEIDRKEHAAKKGGNP